MLLKHFVLHLRRMKKKRIAKYFNMFAFSELCICYRLFGGELLFNADLDI